MDEFSLARTLEAIAIEDMSLEHLKAVCRNGYVTRSLKRGALLELRLRDMGTRAVDGMEDL